MCTLLRTEGEEVTAHRCGLWQSGRLPSPPPPAKAAGLHMLLLRSGSRVAAGELAPLRLGCSRPKMPNMLCQYALCNCDLHVVFKDWYGFPTAFTCGEGENLCMMRSFSAFWLERAFAYLSTMCAQLYHIYTMLKHMNCSPECCGGVFSKAVMRRLAARTPPPPPAYRAPHGSWDLEAGVGAQGRKQLQKGSPWISREMPHLIRYDLVPGLPPSGKYPLGGEGSAVHAWRPSCRVPRLTDIIHRNQGLGAPSRLFSAQAAEETRTAGDTTPPKIKTHNLKTTFKKLLPHHSPSNLHPQEPPDTS
eukprot:1161909-Pelagomonas_calceolata.AAC.21